MERADLHWVVAREGGLTQVLHREDGSAPPAAVGGAATCDSNALVAARVRDSKAPNPYSRLRAPRCNGDFDDYWQFHLNQERHQVHETRYANHVIPAAA
ncbi:MAG: hypothetical protein M5U19_10475 [Microthrixaceae bacterium]|nr:hypothetical protein [Microthrixaceae bacterium]